jgi:hypothetical protein
MINPAIRLRLRDMAFEAIPLYSSGEGILMAQGAWIDLTRTAYRRSCGTIIDFTVLTLPGTRSSGVPGTRSSGDGLPPVLITKKTRPPARYWGARYWGLEPGGRLSL